MAPFEPVEDSEPLPKYMSVPLFAWQAIVMLGFVNKVVFQETVDSFSEFKWLLAIFTLHRARYTIDDGKERQPFRRNVLLQVVGLDKCLKVMANAARRCRQRPHMDPDS